MYVGKKIKQLRISKDLNQSKMAESLGVSQPYYSSVEAGKKPITNKMLGKLHSLYGIELSYFTDKTDSEAGYNYGGVDSLTEPPHTNSREYLKRSYEKFEITKDAAWQGLFNSANEKLQKIEFYYNRILDIKLLLKETLNIKEKPIKKGVTSALIFYEKEIINRFGGDIIYGSIRAKNSTSEELRIFNVDLLDLVNILDLRFFELFDILYKGLRKETLGYKVELPKYID